MSVRSNSPSDEDDEVHEVDVHDIQVVANHFGLSVDTIVTSMLQEAQRQREEETHDALASGALSDISRASGKPHRLPSARGHVPSKLSEESESLLPPQRQSPPVATPSLRSVRVSLANVALDADGRKLEEAMDPSPLRVDLSSTASAATVAIPSTTAGASEETRRNVRFAASEIERVHVYEVDNSLFITIEYSRPLIGWILLLVAIVAGTCTDVLSVYAIASGTSNLYPTVAWSTCGGLVIVAGVILPLWYFLVKPTKVERAFLASRSGLVLLVATGVMGALIVVSFAANAHLTGQWRAMALTAVHPPLIVLFGKVFRNTVFVEEAIGSGVFLLCFVMALFPADLQTSNWMMGELLSFSSGIYIASFLFLAVKARASRVSVPVVASAVVLLQFFMVLIICAVAGVPFTGEDTTLAKHLGGDSSSSGSTSSGSGSPGQESVFGFALNNSRIAKWLVGSIASASSLLCYVMTLRFIPPLTVSVALCLQALAAQFASYLLLFNSATAPWPICPVVPEAPWTPFTIAPTPLPLSSEQALFCGTSGGASNSRNTLFSIGSCIAAVSGGYLVYVSSIKRSKVDRLLKHLKNRKVPKNPYLSRGGTPINGYHHNPSRSSSQSERRSLQQAFRSRSSNARLILQPLADRTEPQRTRSSRSTDGSSADLESLQTLAPSTPTLHNLRQPGRSQSQQYRRSSAETSSHCRRLDATNRAPQPVNSGSQLDDYYDEVS